MVAINLCFRPLISVWKVVAPPTGDGAVQMSYPVLHKMPLELCLGTGKSKFSSLSVSLCC